MLTSPHLLTQSNKEARIQIGQEVPIVTGSQSVVGGESVLQTIQQRDVGRILSITTHVNETRKVTLDIDLEVSDTLPETTVAGTPSFSERTIDTSVVVEDGQSLLIGGIIDNATQYQTSGIPLLRDIPVLGPLFGNTVETVARQELLIMLTPHVIATPEEGRTLTERFKERMEWLDEQLQLLNSRSNGQTQELPHRRGKSRNLRAARRTPTTCSQTSKERSSFSN